MGKIDIAWTGVKNAIGEPLRVALLPELESVSEWFKANMPMIRKEIDATVSKGMAMKDWMKEIAPKAEAARGWLWNNVLDPVARTDSLGITSANNRVAVRDPYGGGADPSLLSGLDKPTLLTLSAGRDYLKKVAEGYADAAKPVAELETTMPAGGFMTDEVKGIGAQMKELLDGYNGTLSELNKMLDRPESDVTQKEFDELIARVQAFAEAARLRQARVAALRAERVNEGGDDEGAFVAPLRDAVEGYRRQLDALRELHAGVAGFTTTSAESGASEPPLGAETSTRPSVEPVLPTSNSSTLPTPTLFAPTSSSSAFASPGGLDVFSDLVRTLGTLTLPRMNAEAVKTTGYLSRLGDVADHVRGVMRDLGDDVAGVIEDALPVLARGGQGGGTSGSGPAAGGIGSVNVTTPTIDVNDASSQIAAKLQPGLRSAIENAFRELSTGINGQRVLDGMVA